MSEHAEIVKLASSVSEAKDNDIPVHLIKIRALLNQYPEFSKERQSLKQDILEYDLLSWCSVVLKFDFMKMKDGFRTAVSIIDILFECCIGLNLNESREFLEEALPDSIQSALLIAWQIQQRFMEQHKLYGAIKYGVHAEELATLKTQYQTITEAIIKVTTSHTSLVDILLKSDNLIRLLIEEGLEVEMMVNTALSMVLRGIRMNPLAVKQMPSVALNHLLDELIYKVTTSSSDELAALTVKIIVAMVDADSEIANKLSVRFKGLKALMTRWLGHGFDRILQNLIAVLDAGNAQIAELARRTHAVKTIWAAYKGWKIRSRVGKLHKVVPSLQSSFRRKRQKKLEYALREKLENEQRHAAEMKRKQSVRSTREKQLQMLEIVPANKVNSHIQKEEEKAAVKIQTIWRGASQRKQFANKQYIHHASKAAIVIQRAVRKFLARRQSMKKGISQPLTVQTKLTKEKREELQMKIDQKQAVRGTKETSLSEAKEIHEKTQQMLLAYHAKNVQKMKYDDPKLQALLAKLKTEQELLQNIPSLHEATSDFVDSLAFNSNVVIVAAENEHKRTLRELTSQWWQKLSLKTGENLNPFDDKSKPVSEAEMQEIEEFLNPTLNQDVLF
ncbi:IQ calmodulin-binding motif-containing protein 1-like [Styela clava]